eukprot:TRINITY_DN5098_c0_g2_i3.p1 TRINITY_DN5098_c0_g2~~TRINITY_DN5098_c0_g2_i3.p1  ORF type:complete len:1229 (+),score=338.54 TRINITY_DN5098_c0_g2_i3:383-4069(+)
MKNVLQQSEHGGTFSVERNDGFELFPMPGKRDRGCTKQLLTTCQNFPQISGLYYGNELGHFCSALCQRPGADWSNWTISTIPPLDQLKENVPTWTIPCRYRDDCPQQYTGRPEYQAMCEGSDVWNGLEECYGSQWNCRPYWAAGRGTGANVCPATSAPTEPPYQCYRETSPPHATWAQAVNQKSPEVVTCRGDATGPNTPCSSMCPEFNRTYYTTGRTGDTSFYSKTRSDYDPRARGWYSPHTSDPPEYGRDSMWYTSVYICATSGMPCLSATSPLYAAVPSVGSVVIPTGAGVPEERMTVTGYVNEGAEMHRVVMRAQDGTVRTSSRYDVRLACASVADCQSTAARPGDCAATCGRDAGLPGVAITAGAQTMADRLLGVLIADYEAWSLQAVLDSITVGKTGGLFIIEQESETAELIAASSSLPCPALLAGRAPGASFDPTCFVKTVDGSPERVSAYDAYAGSIINDVMWGLFPDQRSHMTVGGKQERSVSGYWVDVQPIDPKAEYGIDNVKWILFVVLPKSDFLDDVERARTRTLAVSVAVAAFTCVALLSVAIGMISRPIAFLIDDFDLACDMHIDDILSKPPRMTVLRDISRLQRSFLVLCQHLKEYRSFLPAAVLKARSKEVKPPQGRVAVVFSDIVGSTKLWEADPEGMTEALEVHNNVIRKEIERYSGYEVKTIGDSFMVSFGDPAAAVQFGTSVQEKLLSADWPDADFEGASDKWTAVTDDKGALIWRGIAVRIGIGYDDVQHEENPTTGRCDYRGRAVNLSSRLESSAPHGAVQVSSLCMEAIGGKVKGLEFKSCGHKELKGIGKVETFLAITPGLAPRATTYFSTTPAAPTRLVSSPDEAKLDVRTVGRRRSRVHTVRSFESQARAGNSGDVKINQLTQMQLASKEGSIAIVARIGSQLSEDPRSESARIAYEINKGAANTVTTALRCQGHINFVAGERISVTWNLVSPSGEHVSQALVFASLLTRAVRTAAIGVSSGTLLHGNVGTQRHRFNTVGGFPVHCADAAVGFAADQNVQCIACYKSQTPPSLVDVLRPVDTWGHCTAHSEVTAVNVECPDMQKCRSTLGRGRQVGFSEDSGMETDQDDFSSYRALYTKTLTQGDRESLRALSEMGKASPDDAVLASVVVRLASFLEEEPGGRSYRALVPWIGGGGAEFATSQNLPQHPTALMSEFGAFGDRECSATVPTAMSGTLPTIDSAALPELPHPPLQTPDLAIDDA